MPRNAESVVILMADDDAEDRMLAQRALRAAHLYNDLYFVEDGEELLDYLHQRGDFNDPAAAPPPSVILLDLNMPRKSGREALQEIKAHPRFAHIPVVILTTSEEEGDILQTYRLGASSYIAKPVTFDALVQVMRGLGDYWFEIVRLPRVAGPSHAA